MVGPLSRIQQSSLFMATRVTSEGITARACDMNGSGTAMNTGVAAEMALAMAAKACCASRPAWRQLSGRCGQIIHTA